MIDLKLRAEVRREARSVRKRLDDIDDEVGGVAKKKEAVRSDLTSLEMGKGPAA